MKQMVVVVMQFQNIVQRKGATSVKIQAFRGLHDSVRTLIFFLALLNLVLGKCKPQRRIHFQYLLQKMVRTDNSIISIHITVQEVEFRKFGKYKEVNYTLVVVGFADDIVFEVMNQLLFLLVGNGTSQNERPLFRLHEKDGWHEFGVRI